MDKSLSVLSDISERSVVRTYCYKLFSALLAEPLAYETMELAASDETLELLGCSVDTEGLEPYRSQVNAWRVWGERDRLAWLEAQEGVYNRLFVGPGHLIAPPWESVYMSEDGLLFQPGTLDVRKAYRGVGLATPGNGSEADDHVALELDYMFHGAMRCGDGMCEQEGRSMDEQLHFAQAHLLSWIPQFVERINAAERADFYACVGALLLAFVRADVRWLEEMQASGPVA